MHQYFDKAHFFLLKQKSTTIIFGALILVGGLGWLDYASGYEINFLFIYLFPIALTVGYVNLGVSHAIAVLSIAVWVISNQWAGEEYTSAGILFWNALIQLVIFSTFVVLLNELKTSIAYKKTLAHTDSLTNLNNSSEFHRFVQMEIHRAQRYKSSFAVAYLDLDSFKQVNDKLGRVVGDYLLHYIAQSIKKILRKTDFTARIGGDEFAVLFPEIDEMGAKRAVEKMRDYLANKMTQNQTGVTFSIGIAYFPVPPSYSAEELIKKAEQLMVQAKMQGKNKVVFKQMK